MDNPINSRNNNPLNFSPIPIINNIYSTFGENKQAWEDLLIVIYETPTYQDLIAFLIEKIRNEPSNILTLDIIDFLVDFGPKNLIKEISTKEFMNNIGILILKDNVSSLEIQNKGIYLTKKWNEKAKKFKNENYEGFIHNYMELSKRGIRFPPSAGYKLYTYELYISENEANNIKVIAEKNIQNIKEKEKQVIMNRYINNQHIKNNNFENENSYLQMSNIIFKGDSKYNIKEDNPSDKKQNFGGSNKNIGFPKIDNEEQSNTNPFNYKKKEFPSDFINEFSDINGSEIDLIYRSNIITSKININKRVEE